MFADGMRGQGRGRGCPFELEIKGGECCSGSVYGYGVCVERRIEERQCCGGIIYVYAYEACALRICM